MKSSCNTWQKDIFFFLKQNPQVVGSIKPPRPHQHHPRLPERPLAQEGGGEPTRPGAGQRWRKQVEGGIHRDTLPLKGPVPQRLTPPVPDPSRSCDCPLGPSSPISLGKAIGVLHFRTCPAAHLLPNPPRRTLGRKGPQPGAMSPPPSQLPSLHQWQSP